MGTVAGAALIGRTEELERLRGCTRALTGGDGAVVLVGGDAGAGKTRLLSEAVRAPFLPRGYAVALAGALDYARAPYTPIRDLLVALDKRFPNVLAANRLLAAALRPVLEFRPVPGGDDGASERRRILDAVVEALALYAAQAPIVLVVEDVHWIDSASADVLTHLARGIAALRVLLVLSFRPIEARQDERARLLLAQLGRDAALSLSLGPLSATDAMLLVDDVAPTDLPMDVRRNICRMAEGNPLLLVEFTKLAAENPAALDGSLPVTLKALVADRLAKFDASDAGVLRVAAVMGEFDPPTLGEIARVEEAIVFAALRKARDASIVAEQRDGAPFVFSHALIRHAITEDVLGYELAQLHRSIAERLEREPESPRLHSRLAHHYHFAGIAEKARHYNEIAGREALALYAYSDAALLLERAIDARPMDERTYELYKLLAGAYTGAHRSADAVRVSELLVEFAVARGDAAEIASAGFELSRRRYQALDDDGAIAVVRRALDAIDADSHPGCTFNLRSTLAWYLAQFRRCEEARPELERAGALMAYGEPEALVRYHEAWAAYRVHAGEGLKYRDDLRTALGIARTLGPVLLVRRLDTAIALAMASTVDDMEFAFECAQELWDVARQHPIHLSALPLAMAALIWFLQGRLEEAHAIVSACLGAAEEAPMVSFQLARTGIPLALHLEDPLLLRRVSRPRLLEHAFASNTPNVFGPVAAAVAEHLRFQGRKGEAAALVGNALRRLNDVANNVPLAIEAARSGPGEPLRRALELLDAIRASSRSADAGWHLASAYALGGAARREHALRAAERFEEVGWRLYQAEALEAAGEAERALEIYRASGSVAAVKRLQSQHAARVSAGLSKREWGVAQLVAAGKSNKSIATDLGLSERTVENHIASIFGKLELRSRTEIAAYVARETAQRQ